jgi:hypothetical protein
MYISNRHECILILHLGENSWQLLLRNICNHRYQGCLLRALTRVTVVILNKVKYLLFHVVVTIYNLYSINLEFTGGYSLI